MIRRTERINERAEKTARARRPREKMTGRIFYALPRRRTHRARRARRGRRAARGARTRSSRLLAARGLDDAFRPAVAEHRGAGDSASGSRGRQGRRRQDHARPAACRSARWRRRRKVVLAVVHGAGAQPERPARARAARSGDRLRQPRRRWRSTAAVDIMGDVRGEALARRRLAEPRRRGERWQDAHGEGAARGEIVSMSGAAADEALSTMDYDVIVARRARWRRRAPRRRAPRPSADAMDKLERR